MKSSEQILEAARLEYKPSLIVCCYSGGYDSMVATHKTLAWARQFAISTDIAVISVDTQLHADGWIEYVRASSSQLGVRRFELWRSDRFDEWVEGIRQKAFGHTKAIHKIFFRQLKEAAFRAVLRHYKQHRLDRIMFVTGMRRLESKERADTAEHERFGSNVWCNPLVYWDEEHVLDYRIDRKLPENPFYSEGLGSGDCLCNWHCRVSVETLQRRATEAAKIIMPLDAECRSKFGYGYGEKPSEYYRQEQAGQEVLFPDMPYLCASCERPKASNELRENLLMQRMAW